MKSISTSRVLKLNDKQGGRCFYCGDNLLDFDEVHIDHKDPKANGGTNELKNLCLSCRYCNLTKKDKDIEFMREWIRPYVDGIVKDKKDLKDYHKLFELKKKFSL